VELNFSDSFAVHILAPVMMLAGLLFGIYPDVNRERKVKEKTNLWP